MVDEAESDGRQERCSVRHMSGAQCLRHRGHPWLHLALVNGVGHAWSEPPPSSARRKPEDTSDLY